MEFPAYHGSSPDQCKVPVDREGPPRADRSAAMGLDLTGTEPRKASMVRFLFLKESKTYLNLDHVTEVKLQEQAGKQVAEVLFTGIDRPELVSGADVSVIIRALDKDVR